MQTDLIPKVQAALLMIVTKDVIGLIGRGQFEEALPVVMDAVLKGQALYFPHDPLNLVPVYLLAVQVPTWTFKGFVFLFFFKFQEAF